MFKWIAYGIAAIAVVLLAPLLWIALDESAGQLPDSGLPWQIEQIAPGQTRVFSLQPGVSTLQEAIDQFGRDVEVAIVVAPGKPASLEAYFEDTRAGFITGRATVTVDIGQGALQAMRARALKEAYMESTTRKITLHPDDLATARALPIVAIGFMPTADLDEAIILQRFGEPASTISSHAHLTHYLYPEQGLHIALDLRGKELLQYVAPRDFARLQQPLELEAATHTGEAPGEPPDTEPGETLEPDDDAAKVQAE